MSGVLDRFGRVIDRAVSAISPEAAVRRERARAQLLLAGASGYGTHGASSTKNTVVGWSLGSGSPAADIDLHQKTLRERTRDLYIGAPLARGAVDTVTTNVVGAGLVPDPDIDHEFLGLSPDEAAEFNRTIKREFSLWADSTDCSLSRTSTFYQEQGLALLSALVGGDVFCTLPVKPRKGQLYDLRINLIEGDLVSSPNWGNTEQIISGVECDDDGEPVAYYVCNSYPRGRFSQVRGDTLEWARVPVYGELTGRPNILHVMHHKERPGQRRGVPLLAPVIESLKQLSRYAEAELVAAVVSAYFTVFIKSETPNNPLQPMFRPGQELQNNPVQNSYEMGPGAIVGLNPNESIETANPGRPSATYDAFVTAVTREIGAALGIPYEVLIKHFQSSYSASRGAILEAEKMFRMRRSWLVSSFCQPVFDEWIAEAVAKGRIHAPGFFEDPAVRAAWSRVRWYGPSQGQLDPLKEARAAKLRVDEGFSTRAREAAELSGLSYDDIHNIRVREEQRRRSDQLSLFTPANDADFTDAPEEEAENA